MANPKRGEVRIEIGGKDRLLRLDFNAMCELEELHGGRSIIDLYASGRKVGVSTLRNTLWAGLKRGEKGAELTPEMVGDWMSDEPERLGEWSLKIREALVGAWGKTPEKKDGEGSEARPPKPPPSSTGTN